MNGHLSHDPALARPKSTLTVNSKDTHGSEKANNTGGKRTITHLELLSQTNGHFENSLNSSVVASLNQGIDPVSTAPPPSHLPAEKRVWGWESDGGLVFARRKRVCPSSSSSSSSSTSSATMPTLETFSTSAPNPDSKISPSAAMESSSSSTSSSALISASVSETKAPPLSSYDTGKSASSHAMKAIESIGADSFKFNAIAPSSSPSVRRKSLTLRSHRRSSSRFGSTPLHPDIPSQDFHKHINVELPGPLRMRQLLIWCIERQLEQIKSKMTTMDELTSKAVSLVTDLKTELEGGRVNTSWFNRPSAASEVPPTLPNPKNIENLRVLRANEYMQSRLREEEAEWHTFHDSRMRQLQELDEAVSSHTLAVVNSRMDSLSSSAASSSSASASASASESKSNLAPAENDATPSLSEKSSIQRKRIDCTFQVELLETVSSTASNLAETGAGFCKGLMVDINRYLDRKENLKRIAEAKQVDPLIAPKTVSTNYYDPKDLLRDLSHAL